MKVESWRGKAQLAAWEYAHSLWTYQNKLLHEDTPEEKLEIESTRVGLQVEEKLRKMVVDQSGHHLRNLNIPPKNLQYQKFWLRTVKAKEQKYKYDQRRDKYFKLREWVLESRSTNEARNARWQHRTQQAITSYYEIGTVPGTQQEDSS